MIDDYFIRRERDDAAVIIRKCQRILSEYRPDGSLSENEMVKRLRALLDGPETPAIRDVEHITSCGHL
jgi:hypothetical protein